ncbi:hypothetical protein C8J57DRAFT_1250915 [Mycena rebaudengoi]|nr:hypothetical protein C8J57DRAFT_1250915 [Mycena rebaudengoi]
MQPRDFDRTSKWNQAMFSSAKVALSYLDDGKSISAAHLCLKIVQPVGKIIAHHATPKLGGGDIPATLKRSNTPVTSENICQPTLTIRLCKIEPERAVKQIGDIGRCIASEGQPIELKKFSGKGHFLFAHFLPQFNESSTRMRISLTLKGRGDRWFSQDPGSWAGNIHKTLSMANVELKKSGKFNTHQNAHIESFMPDFVKELNRGLEGVPLTHWKQAKASHILESDLFSNLDMSEISRKGWFDMIVRKFTNYRNQVYRKSPGHEMFSTAISSKRANPLLKFSSVLSGRELFAKTNSEFIDAATQQRVLDTGNKTHAAVYQTILKEKWDSLTGEQQSTWNAKAEEQASNIQQNQQEFAPTMTAALRDLCQGKLFGDAEMLLFYVFRQPDTGDLLAGTIHGHCTPNRQHFGGSPEDLDLNYGQPWSEFAEEAIPRPILINPSIPRNGDGQPVFPPVTLDHIPVADLRTLLCEYFDQCWAHHLMGRQMKPLPWAEIISAPRKHCDADERLLQIKLAHPQDLTTVEVITLTQVLLSTSVIDSPKPFRFLEVQEMVPVIPPPPAPPVPVSPSVGS